MTRLAAVLCAALCVLVAASPLTAAGLPALCAAPGGSLLSPPLGGTPSGDLGVRLFGEHFQSLSSCGPNFCTAAQRTQCDNQCLQEGHGTFVGLECCTDSCQTLCVCGSRPIAC